MRKKNKNENTLLQIPLRKMVDCGLHNRIKNNIMKIKEGMPQPIDCENCGGKFGYKIIKIFQISSDDCFDEFGIYQTMIDSEYRKIIRILKTPHCNECNEKLNFKILT